MYSAVADDPERRPFRFRVEPNIRVVVTVIAAFVAWLDLVKRKSRDECVAIVE